MYPDINLDLVTKKLTESSSIQLSTTVQNRAHYVHFLYLHKEVRKENLSTDFLTNAFSFSVSFSFTSHDLAQAGEAF